jgi:hypothetical protein
MEKENAGKAKELSEDALVLAVLFMYLPPERQKEILEQIKKMEIEDAHENNCGPGIDVRDDTGATG